MTLAEIVKRLNLKVYAGEGGLARPVSGGYAGDLLSDVIAHSRKDQLWITLQIHPNVIAVAALKDLAAIVFVNGREPAPETAAQAEKERIPLCGTTLSAYELAGRAYALGLLEK
ncbi:MAG: serine kinase [Candidatus Aminicenantes bacterium]|nr:serine kinase [Candidatus Aminicenantes bacterium]